MDRTSGGVPLLSLDAVVIDTETTGLDPRKARVIELAGVRLSAASWPATARFANCCGRALNRSPPRRRAFTASTMPWSRSRRRLRMSGQFSTGFSARPW